jgi:hypothetical protein
MPFLPPLTSSEREKLDIDKLGASISMQLTEHTVGTPLERMEDASKATADFASAYEEYRVDGIGSEKELNMLVKQIKNDLGDKRGAEAARAIVSAVDEAISAALGRGHG